MAIGKVKSFVAFTLLALCVVSFSIGTAQAAKKIVMRANIEQNPKSYPDDPRVMGTIKFQELMKQKVGDKFEVP